MAVQAETAFQKGKGTPPVMGPQLVSVQGHFSSKSATVAMAMGRPTVQYVQQHGGACERALESSSGVVDACAPRMWWHLVIRLRVRLNSVGPEKPVALRRSNDDHKGEELIECH